MAPVSVAEVPVLPFPSDEVRQKISEKDLRTCFSSWDAIAQKLLELPTELFQTIFASTGSDSISNLLTSYVSEIAQLQHDEGWKRLEEAQRFHRTAFYLVHRTLTQLQPPPDGLLQWTFLGQYCKVYQHSDSLSDLMGSVWIRQQPKLAKLLGRYRQGLSKSLDDGNSSVTHDDLLSHTSLQLLRVCPRAAEELVAGSDFLDSIGLAYPGLQPQSQSQILLLVYIMLCAPLKLQKPNRSLVYDHLYSLKAKAEQKSDQATKGFLADLVTETPFISQLRKLIAGTSDETRGTSLATALEQYRKATSSRPKNLHRRKIDKGKGKAADGFGHGETFNNIHVHRMSLISQVQDLFPNLGEGFVVKLLDAYNDSVEEATAALLEDNLPPHLQAADRTEHLNTQTSAQETDTAPTLAPPSTPPPPTEPASTRRNIHNNDAFDRLAIRPSQLHRGHKDTDSPASNPDHTSRTASKAAIMSALSAFDADDDERDDTYDIADVGGSVDTAAGPEGDQNAGVDEMREKNEEALFAAWKMDRGAFGRDAATRRGRQREALRSETQMTDEAVEGWAIMLQRDPPRLRKLEAKYATFAGKGQGALMSTRWQGKREDGVDSEDGGGVSSGGEDARGGYRGRGRGGGGRGGRGGAGVAGPSNDKGTQISRDRKEASKGSRANHNRRDQRARKMGRGGFPG